MSTPTDGPSLADDSVPRRLSFEGRTALVTGAGGDIGRATAVRLATGGARVVLADIADAVEVTADACRQANAAADPIVTRFDVTNETEVQRAVDDLAATGVIADLLVNNAGYQGRFENVAEYDVTDFRRVLEINVTGVFVVLRCFARALAATGRPGAVVNTASMAQHGAPNMAAYSASKAAVVALTKVAAKDLAPQAIRVNSVSPAFIGPGAMWDNQVAAQARTPSQYYSDRPDEVAAQMIASVPLRRFGSLDEVAAAIEFLLSDDASYITAFDLVVSGGSA